MEIWDSRCQSVADRAGFSSSLCAAKLRCGRSACTYLLHVPHCGRGMGCVCGYATSDFLLFILTFWSLHAEHTVQLFYMHALNTGQFKPDSNQWGMHLKWRCEKKSVCFSGLLIAAAAYAPLPNPSSTHGNHLSEISLSQRVLSGVFVSAFEQPLCSSICFSTLSYGTWETSLSLTPCTVIQIISALHLLSARASHERRKSHLICDVLPVWLKHGDVVKQGANGGRGGGVLQ